MELRDLLISKVRVKILEIFLSDPEEMYHVRELVRRTGEEINAVRRELEHMEKSGMVKKEPRGNRLYYWFRKDYLFYDQLLAMVAKTTGLGREILKNREKIGKISFVSFSQKFVKRIPRGKDEVDILVVGEIVLPELAALIKAEETRRDQEINYTVMTSEEFTFRKKRRDPFLLGILSGAKVMIIGEEIELVSF
jgi:DNA-binding transcriptional ArsR family regulator